MQILRVRAFTPVDAGGNPAGVVIDQPGLDDAAMLAVAAEVGFSETAFLTSAGDATYDVRYFAPEMEVPFCGHATIGAAAALMLEGHVAGDEATVLLRTPSGEVPVTVRRVDGAVTAELTSVEPSVRPATEAEVTEALAALAWSRDDLDPSYAPAVAYAGAHHLVLATRTRERLAELHYDVPRLKALLDRLDAVTAQLFFREPDGTVHARNPFPGGGVYEDPATGAAAVALGAYLRAGGHVADDATFTIHQGDDMGSPSTLTVSMTAGDARVRVAGAAALMAG